MTISKEFIGELRTSFRGEVRLSEPMRDHTSFRIGGPADVLVIPRDLPDLVSVLRILRKWGLPYFIMGNGTNLLVRDEGIRGVVVKLGGALCELRREGHEVYAGAGLLLPELSRWAASQGLSGLEFASGIPGSVGGAIVMNAGAYGRSMGDVVLEVELLCEDGSIELLDKSRVGFGPRGTSLPAEGRVVVGARFGLSEGDRDEIEREVERLLADRRAKQPLALPSAGCVFKNPKGGGAGRFIDWAGLKGLSVGGARVSEKHANFIVNTGDATAKDVLALMEQVRARVRERFGVVLEPEIKIIGG